VSWKIAVETLSVTWDWSRSYVLQEIRHFLSPEVSIQVKWYVFQYRRWMYVIIGSHCVPLEGEVTTEVTLYCRGWMYVIIWKLFCAAWRYVFHLLRKRCRSVWEFDNTFLKMDTSLFSGHLDKVTSVVTSLPSVPCKKKCLINVYCLWHSHHDMYIPMEIQVLVLDTSLFSGHLGAFDALSHLMLSLQ
jgi:hypothetical protein